MSAIIHKFVEACIFKFENDKAWYLLLRRAKNESYYPNIWQFVSGTMDEHETAVEAARREIAEETGLTPVHVWVLPHVNSFYDQIHDTLNLSPMFAVQVSPGSLPVLSPEHSEFAWCTFEEAQRKLLWRGQQQGLQIVHDVIIAGKEAARYVHIG